jgi:hypothetical protein
MIKSPLLYTEIIFKFMKVFSQNKNYLILKKILNIIKIE